MAPKNNTGWMVPPPPVTPPAGAILAGLPQAQPNPFDDTWETQGDTATAQAINPFDDTWEQPQAQAQPQPAAPLQQSAPIPQPKPAAAQPKQITRKAGTIKPPIMATPPPPVDPWAQAGAAAQNGIYQAARGAYHGLPNVPIVGPMLAGMAQTAKHATTEYQANPAAAFGATAAGIPAGLAGFADDLINIGRVVTGKAKQIPAADMRGAYSKLPVVAPFAQASPAAFEAGAFAGGMAIPIPGGALAAGTAKIGNPIIKSLARGAIAGGTFGGITAAGAQAKEKGSINLKKALTEGALPGALIGGALDSAGSAAVRKLKKPAQAKDGGSAPAAAQPKPEDIVKLDDGSTFTAEEALKVSRDKAVPIEQRADILLKLEERRRTATGGKAEQPDITKILDGKEVTLTGEQAVKAAKLDKVFEIQRKQIQEQYKGAADVQREMIKPLQKNYMQALNEIAGIKPQEQAPGAKPAAPAPKPKSFMQAGAEGLFNKPEPVKPQGVTVKFETDPNPPPPKPPEPEYNTYKPEPLPETDPLVIQERVAHERRQFDLEKFPETFKEYGDENAGRKWEPQRLSDHEVDVSLDFLDRMAATRKSGNLTGYQSQQRTSLLQEKMRRETWKAKGWEQNWPTDDNGYWGPKEKPPEPVLEDLPQNAEALPAPQDAEPVTISDAQELPPPKPVLQPEPQLEPASQPDAGLPISEKPPEPAPDYSQATLEELQAIADWGTEAEQIAAIEEMGRRPGPEPKAAEPAPKTEPEISTPQTPQTPEPAPAVETQPSEPRYTAGADPDPAKAKKGYNAVFNPDGTVKSSSKRSLAQAQAVADQHNAGAVKPSQGIGDRFIKQSEPTEHRTLLMDNGDPLPNHASDSVKTKLSELAAAKNKYDAIQAEANAAYDAWLNVSKQPKMTLTKRKAAYSPEIERELIERDRKSPDLGFEVTAAQRRAGSYQFKPGTDGATAGAKVLELMQRANEAKRAYEGIRAKSVSEVEAAIRNGDLPASLIIDHPEGKVNLRLAPKQGSALRQELMDRQGEVGTEEQVSRTIKQVKEYLGDAAASAKAYRAAGGKRSQKGSVVLPLGGGNKKPTTTEAVAASVAEGAKQSKEISDLANSAEKIKRVFNLRRTLDFAREQNPDLHNHIWEGIAKETRLARGLKFTPDQAGLIEKSLSMDWEDVLAGADGLDAFSFEQRDYLSKRQLLRKQSADAVKEELKTMLEFYEGNKQMMPEAVSHRYQVLEQLEQSLRGRSLEGKDGGDFTALKDLTNGMYDYVFKWNTAYHALNLLDPLVIGSARLGLQRIGQAKLAIQLDPKIKEFLHGHEPKDALRQLREEADISAELPTGVKRTKAGEALVALQKFRNRLPDLPSEAWNYQDALAASIIEHGDKTGYQGGGGQLLHDMAHGKLSAEAEVKVYTEALQAVQDITGSGSLGLDKDPVQRNPFARYLVQFSSQPYRVARLLSDWKRQGNYGAIFTFLAATATTAGAAVIPKEVESILQAGPPEAKAFLFAMQDFADSVNIVNKVFGRDLTDKMRFAFIPVLGGAAANMVMDLVNSRMREFYGQKYDKLTKSALLLVLSNILGGGGLQADKFVREFGNIAKGEKEVWASASTLTKDSGKLLGSQTLKPYGAIKGISNALLPGTDSESGAIVKSIRRKAAQK